MAHPWSRQLHKWVLNANDVQALNAPLHEAEISLPQPSVTIAAMAQQPNAAVPSKRPDPLPVSSSSLHREGVIAAVVSHSAEGYVRHARHHCRQRPDIKLCGHASLLEEIPQVLTRCHLQLQGVQQHNTEVCGLLIVGKAVGTAVSLSA